MLLTPLTSQSPMLPYVVTVVAGLVSHAVTAVPMLASVMALRTAPAPVQPGSMLMVGGTDGHSHTNKRG